MLPAKDSTEPWGMSHVVVRGRVGALGKYGGLGRCNRVLTVSALVEVSNMRGPKDLGKAPWVKQLAPEAEAKHGATMGLTTVSIIDQISGVRAQIAVVQAQTQAKVASASGRGRHRTRSQKELEAIAPLTEAQKREIDTSLAAAKAKLIAAGASKSVVQGFKDEISAIYKKLDVDQATTNSTSRGISTTNADTASRQANTSAIDSQTAALEKQKGLSSTGLTICCRAVSCAPVS